MSVGNLIAIQFATLLKDGNGSGEIFTARNDMLTQKEWDLLHDVLEDVIGAVFQQGVFSDIFKLKSLQVGELNTITLIYRGPTDSLYFYKEKVLDVLYGRLDLFKIETHDNHIIMVDDLEFVEDVRIGKSTYIVKYNETHTITEDDEYNITFDEVEVTVGPDATVKNLVDAVANKTGYGRDKYWYLVFDNSGKIIEGFQKKLRTCCFGLEVVMRMVEKTSLSRSPWRSKRKKSPKSSRRSNSPLSPRNKPVSNPTYVDVNRLYSGRSTKKSDAYSVKEIKDFLKERGLKQVGNKAELVERLRNHL